MRMQQDEMNVASWLKKKIEKKKERKKEKVEIYTISKVEFSTCSGNRCIDFKGIISMTRFTGPVLLDNTKQTCKAF